MTKRRTIDITARSGAGVADLYALLADGTTWPSWSSIESFELEQAGDPPPEGVGAIRVYRRGRTTGRDQITELVPERRFAYASLSGLPVRDYLGEVDLDPTPTGSVIHWRASFLPKFPGTGWMLERGVRKFLDDTAQGLARYGTAAAPSRTQPESARPSPA
jgi:Polyketide cyclase / dehydrase and lipid transport